MCFIEKSDHWFILIEVTFKVLVVIKIKYEIENLLCLTLRLILGLVYHIHWYWATSAD